MKKFVIHPERCKGCGYCIRFCPKKALGASQSFINEKGYYPAEHVNNDCIYCGICYTVCPDYVFEIDTDAPEGAGASENKAAPQREENGHSGPVGGALR